MECPKCKEESDYKIERGNEVIFRCGNKSCTVMVFVSKSAWRALVICEGLARRVFIFKSLQSPSWLLISQRIVSGTPHA